MTKINKELLSVLVCPETKNTLTLAKNELIGRINAKIKEEVLVNREEKLITQVIDGGLIRSDRKYLYPIRESIPIMLPEKAIPLKDFLDIQSAKS